MVVDCESGLLRSKIHDLFDGVYDIVCCELTVSALPLHPTSQFKSPYGAGYVSFPRLGKLSSRFAVYVDMYELLINERQKIG